MKKIFILYLTIITLVACKNISTRENDPEDIKTGQKFLDNFYSSVKNKNYNQAASLGGEEVSPVKLLSILNKIDSVWGNLKTYEFISAGSTVRTINGKTDAVYNFKIKTQYDKSSHNDENVILRIINDSLKITGYHSVQIL